MEQLKIMINCFWTRINSFSISQKPEPYIIIDLNKEEITNIDKIQDKYLTWNDGMGGMDSANYISDTVLYIRLLRILKKEELSTSERLFIIEILSKYKKYLEFYD